MLFHSMSHALTRWAVRVGLFCVRCLLGVKAIIFGGIRIIVRIVTPGMRGLLSVFVVPVYRAGFSSRHHIAQWYRPAKNKVMFFLTNRAMMHVAIFGVVSGVVVINLRMESVRAETLDAFNKSIAYALVTQEDSPFIEEYADMDVAALRNNATSYLSGASLVPIVGAIDGQDSFVQSTPSFAGGGLAAPIIADSSASVAPRDGVEIYVVAVGDTSSTIAARFGISTNTLFWANNLSAQSVLRPGQELTILPMSGVMHTVKNGDTLTKIASTYHADSTEILRANTLADAGGIATGQKLFIPGGTPPTPTPVKRPTSVATIFAPAPSKTGVAVSASSRMIWPSDGKRVMRGLSWYHTGADIDCNGHANGTSTDDNYAAADGVVTFAGARFQGPRGGYGNLVIIDHGNGLSTRYGHNYAIYVKAGQRVTAGTPIARCGSTGDSSGTHLHFEVIGGNGSRDYRNPLEYIR